jgi:hypothetical protein
MKTKDVIRLLQEADPSGEMQACVANMDIVEINVINVGYWDGCLQILERDPNDPERIVGGRFCAGQPKVDIYCLNIDDFVYSDPELPVSYDSAYAHGKYHARIEAVRVRARAAKARRENPDESRTTPRADLDETS